MNFFRLFFILSLPLLVGFSCGGAPDSPDKKNGLLDPIVTPPPPYTPPDLSVYSKIYVYSSTEPSILKGSICPHVLYLWNGAITLTETNITTPTGNKAMKFTVTGSGAGAQVRTRNGGNVAADTVDMSSFSNGYWIGWFKSANMVNANVEVTTLGAWGQLSLGNFGYIGDDNWHKVVIPIKAWVTNVARTGTYNLKNVNCFFEFLQINPANTVGTYVLFDDLHFSKSNN